MLPKINKLVNVKHLEKCRPHGRHSANVTLKHNIYCHSLLKHVHFLQWLFKIGTYIWFYKVILILSLSQLNYWIPTPKTPQALLWQVKHGPISPDTRALVSYPVNLVFWGRYYAMLGNSIDVNWNYVLKHK